MSVAADSLESLPSFPDLLAIKSSGSLRYYAGRAFDILCVVIYAETLGRQRHSGRTGLDVPLRVSNLALQVGHHNPDLP